MPPSAEEIRQYTGTMLADLDRTVVRVLKPMPPPDVACMTRLCSPRGWKPFDYGLWKLDGPYDGCIIATLEWAYQYELAKQFEDGFPCVNTMRGAR